MSLEQQEAIAAILDLQVIVDIVRIDVFLELAGDPLGR
jgi:hypothetical protein